MSRHFQIINLGCDAPALPPEVKERIRKERRRDRIKHGLFMLLCMFGMSVGATMFAWGVIRLAILTSAPAAP